MHNLLRVNMSTGLIFTEQLPEQYALLGGRGLSSRLLLEEVPADCDPLGSQNKLIFAVGLLGGTTLSSANRISVGGKSPLTGGIKEANGGGTTALRLAKLGYRAVIIEEKAQPGQTFYLLVGDGVCELKDANHLKGLGCFETAKILQQEWGLKAAIALIGPAGENLMNLAGVAHTDQEGMPTRYSARGGLGAVMGSKGLKAIVILPSKSSSQDSMVNRELWSETARNYIHVLQTTDSTAETKPKFGTAMSMEIMNSLGVCPTRNFSSGTFEKAAEIGGVKLREVILERGGEGKTTHACMPGCIVRCSNRYPDQDGKLLCTPIEYENLAFLGSNLGNSSLDSVAKLNFLCNDIGIDVIETGAAIAVAMEAGVSKFGDAAAAEDMMIQIREATKLGVLLGQGAVATGKALGVTRVVAFKGQTVGAYDPRAFKVNAVTFATSPMGGDHTAGNAIQLKINHRDPKGTVEISRNLQITSAWVDTLGICTFVRVVHSIDSSIFPTLINSRFDCNWTAEDLHDLGKKVLHWELEFNRRAGLSDAAAVPEFLKKEPVPPSNCIWDVSETEIEEIWTKAGL